MNRHPAYATLLLGAIVSPLGAQQTAAPPALEERVVDQRPELVPNSCQPPQYPDSLRAAGVEGRVLVALVIDTAGQAEPGSVRVLSSTNIGFEASARAAVVSCRYRAGRVGGRPVRTRIQIPLNLTLPARSPDTDRPSPCTAA